VNVVSCPFCEEIDDPERSEFRSLFPANVLETRTVAEDRDFRLIAGIGAIRPGYLLLLPKSHVRCFGHLTEPQLRVAEGWRTRISHNLKLLFGPSLMFEHGSISAAKNAGGCIDHAHMHFVPTVADAIPRVATDLPGKEISRLTDLLRDRTHDEPYVLVSQKGHTRLFFPNGRMPSQYMRRIIVDLEGRPDRWDWVLFPEPENLLETMSVITRASVTWRPRG
jgi:diadenosine tetraphosphate (Ap4A) HIT family hydrolase